MPTVLPLTKLVDLALGTPEVGAVNFNVLHTLLHAMLAKLNLSESKAEINDSDRDFLSTNKPQRVLTALSDIDSGKGEESEDGFSVSEVDSPATSASHRSKRSSAPYHHLELRVEKLAEQLESLNALPTNADLFERAKAKGDGERPMSEMWQYMQMKKRVDANEDGVSKLMSIVEDLMKEMTSLREANADLLSKINDLNMDDLNKRLAELEKVTNDLNDKFSTLPSADDFAQYVTWPLLEDALKGVRKDIEGLQTPDRVVVEIASQTDPKTPSRPPSSRPLSRLSTTSSGPTDSLLDVLERLGKLSEDHEALTKRVEELEEQLKNKVDKEALENLNLSGDMLDQLNKLKEELDALMAMRDKLPSAMSGADSLQKYASKWSSFRSMSIPASQPTSDGETSDTGTVSGSEGVEQSGSSMELMSVLRSRISDSEAFEELISRLGNLEDRFKNLHSAILNPMAMTEDSGFTSEPVSDLRSFLSDMEDKIGFLSSASSNTQLTDGTSEAEVRPKKKSKGKRKQSLSTTQETDSLEVEKTDFNQFSGIFDSDSADDDARDPAIMNAVSVEIAHTNEKLKKLGCTLDNQMGELKDKVFALDHDLKRMAKGVEFALLRSRVGGMSDMSVTASQQDHEERILKVASAQPTDSRNTSLQDNRLIDNDALSRAQQAILQLQAEMERLQNTTQNIISENQHRSKQIESLLTYCDTLQEKKADKDYVAMEVDVKADKRQLEGKVNHSLFDSTTNDINKLIKDILEKMDGHDSGWKDAYKQLSEDVEGKLDRLEIDPLKEWLESRLKALNKKIMANANHEWGEDDAAGLRKQLIQRFNCLSCDRPVDLMPSGPVPSLPSQNGLPGTRSPRPYTTFELEQIRQHAKSGLLGKNMVNFERALAEKELAKMRKADLRAFLVHFGQDMEALARRHQQEQPADFGNQEVADYYATVRQCGGSHTLTYPHKRVSRMTQMNNLFKDEVAETQQQETTTPVFPIYKEEVDVQGVDGHIYRGRMERVQIEAKMPSKMPKSPGPRGPVRKIPHSESEPVGTTPAPPTHSRGRPVSARNTGSPRPGSGRPTSRPQSRPLSARNSGQESSRTTPFPDESIPMQDGEQGQTTVEAEAIRVDVPTPDVLEDPAEE